MSADHAKQLDTLLIEVRKLRAESRRLQQEIKDSKKYLKEQGEIVEDTIAEWNTQLVEFGTEIQAVQEEKNKITADIFNLEQERNVLSREVKTIENKLSLLDTSYENKVTEYRTHLKELSLKK